MVLVVHYTTCWHMKLIPNGLYLHKQFMILKQRNENSYYAKMQEVARKDVE